MFKATLKNKPNEDICLLLSLDNHSYNYICECGEASELSVKDCLNTKAIFISHTHIDHFIGFDKILRFQLGMGERVTVCGPIGIAAQLQAKIKAYQWNLIEPDSISYEIREITSPNQYDKYLLEPPLWDLQLVESNISLPIYSTKDFEVQFAILDHKTPSIAYLFVTKDSIQIDMSKSPYRGGAWIKQLKIAFEQEDKELILNIDNQAHLAADLFYLLSVKKGHRLGVIMDHGATRANHDKIKKTFANADQVYIESFFRNEDQDAAMMHFHSYSTASAQIMKTCGVKDAFPVHFSRKYNAEEIANLKEEFYDVFR